MSDFIDYLLELSAPLKEVRARKMFGGNGIFKEGLMVGLVADEVLYLKVDQETISDYEEMGLGPFVYEKKGKKMAMSYYQTPEDAMDESSELCEWAEKAYLQHYEPNKKSQAPLRKQNLVRQKRLLANWSE